MIQEIQSMVPTYNQRKFYHRNKCIISSNTIANLTYQQGQQTTKKKAIFEYEKIELIPLVKKTHQLTPLSAATLQHLSSSFILRQSVL